MSVELKLPEIYHKQGTDKTFLITITENGVAKNITGFEIYFVVRRKDTLKDEDNTEAVINTTATITTPLEGKAELSITRDDTLDIEVTDYIYEISYKNAENKIISHYGYGDFRIDYLSNKII